MNILEVKAGDIVFETKSGRERVVVSARPDLGLLEFAESALQGWSQMTGFAPTGRRVAESK